MLATRNWSAENRFRRPVSRYPFFRSFIPFAITTSTLRSLIISRGSSNRRRGSLEWTRCHAPSVKRVHHHVRAVLAGSGRARGLRGKVNCLCVLSCMHLALMAITQRYDRWCAITAGATDINRCHTCPRGREGGGGGSGIIKKYSF